MELEKATIGTDYGKVYEIMTKIHSELIETAQQNAKDGLDALIDDVPNHWTGATADAFIEKIGKDRDTFNSVLEEIYDRMKDDIEQMSMNVSNADAQVGQHMKEANN